MVGNAFGWRRRGPNTRGALPIWPYGRSASARARLPALIALLFTFFLEIPEEIFRRIDWDTLASRPMCASSMNSRRRRPLATMYCRVRSRRCRWTTSISRCFYDNHRLPLLATIPRVYVRVESMFGALHFVCSDSPLGS